LRGLQKPTSSDILASNMPRGPEMDRDRLHLCDVCKMRKLEIITLGMDRGNGFQNRSVCKECLPMVMRPKKEK
jgi:hypothetical protein